MKTYNPALDQRRANLLCEPPPYLNPTAFNSYFIDILYVNRFFHNLTGAPTRLNRAIERFIPKRTKRDTVKS